MRTRAYLNKTVATIKGEVSLHPPIGVEADFRDTDRDCPLVCELQECCTISFPLLLRPNRDAVDQQMVGSLLQDRDADSLAVDLQDPNLAALDPRRVVLESRFRNRTDHSLIRGNVGVCADLLHHTYIRRTGAPHDRWVTKQPLLRGGSAGQLSIGKSHYLPFVSPKN
jgi:hypothetical protein